MLALPDRLEAGDGRRRQARRLGAQQRLEGLGEVDGADALEVEPGDQLLQAPGLPQVGGQDGRGGRLPSVGGAAVPDPGFLDLDGSEAGLEGPLGQVAIADHLLVPGLILEVGVVSDPGGGLGLDGLGEHPAGAVPEDLGEDVLAGVSVFEVGSAGYAACLQ
jgi:hypothetical protein